MCTNNLVHLSLLSLYCIPNHLTPACYGRTSGPANIQATAGDEHVLTFVLLFYFHRPLPSEMVRYAREDTHYLLYICDRLHNELIKSGNVNNNLLQSVYSRSKDICLKVGMGSNYRPVLISFPVVAQNATSSVQC